MPLIQLKIFNEVFSPVRKTKIITHLARATSAVLVLAAGAAQ